MPLTQPPRSVPWNGGSIISPPDVRSRSHGRPLARWSDSDVGWNCTDTHTSAIAECWQLLSGKSMSR